MGSRKADCLMNGKKGMHGRDSREEYFEMEISLSKDGAETTICTSSMS